MLRDQVYNFAPGPSTMPESALKTAAAEMLNADDGRCRLRRRDIALGCDFARTFPEIAFRIVVTVQLYKFVHMAFMFLAEYVIWKIRTRREKKAAALAQREDDNGRQQDE